MNRNAEAKAQHEAAASSPPAASGPPAAPAQQAESGARAGSGRPEAAPPPVPDPDSDRPGSRRLSTDGVDWVAWVSGTGTAGTGSHGLGLLDAVHFAPAANGDRRKHREALLERGRFPNLFDEELLTLFRGATPLKESPPPAKNGRRNGRRR